MSERIDLLSNVAATGNWKPVRGGRYILFAEGTWAGATLTLQFQGPKDLTTAIASDATLTANGAVLVDIAGGASVRAAISGGPPSNVYASLTSCP